VEMALLLLSPVKLSFLLLLAFVCGYYYSNICFIKAIGFFHVSVVRCVLAMLNGVLCVYMCMCVCICVCVCVCVSSASGKVLSWGKGHRGCLGHGDEKDSPQPRIVDKLKTVVVCRVACGWDHTSVITGCYLV